MSPERISAISSQNNNVKIDFNSRDSREANSIVELGAKNNFIHIQKQQNPHLMLNTSVTNTHGGRIDGSWIGKNGTSSVDSSGTNQQIKDKRIIAGNNIDMSRRIGVQSTDNN